MSVYNKYFSEGKIHGTLSTLNSQLMMSNSIDVGREDEYEICNSSVGVPFSN